MAYQTETSFCPRDPKVQTNLRCGRCGSLICPSCLVQSPVGSRCPSCARIGRSPLQKTSGGELSKAIVAGVLTAMVGGAAIFGILELVPRNQYGVLLGTILGFVAVGYLVGEAVRRAVGYKLDKRIQYTAGVSVFAAYIVVITIYQMTGGVPQFMVQFITLVALAVGMWVAMGRVRP